MKGWIAAGECQADVLRFQVLNVVANRLLAKACALNVGSNGNRRKNESSLLAWSHWLYGSGKPAAEPALASRKPRMVTR